MNARALTNDNPRELIPNSTEYLITVGLGYCCMAFFWKRYEHVSSVLIGARLGLHPRTIRRHRQAFARGETVCLKNYACMSHLLETPL